MANQCFYFGGIHLIACFMSFLTAESWQENIFWGNIFSTLERSQNDGQGHGFRRERTNILRKLWSGGVTCSYCLKAENVGKYAFYFYYYCLGLSLYFLVSPDQQLVCKTIQFKNFIVIVNFTTKLNAVQSSSGESLNTYVKNIFF